MGDAVVKDGRVQLRGANGQAFSVPKEQLGDALSGGEFRLETPDEFHDRSVRAERSTLGQQALTVGEGALRGATFGAGTVLANEIGGDDYRQAALERAAANPKAYTAGEIGGAVAPALLTGGSGAAGAVARASPTALVGRLGEAAAEGAGALAERVGLGGEGFLSSVARSGLRSGISGAVEGGAYGLGSSAADASLEGVDWTADRALAGLESGALYGGKAGLGLGAGGTALGRGMKAAASEVVDAMLSGGTTLRRAVENWAEETASGSWAGKASEGADSLVSRLTKDGTEPERLERLSARIKEAGYSDASRAEIVDFSKREAARAGQAKAEMAAEFQSAGARPDGAAIGDLIAKSSADLKAAGHADAARRLRRFAGDAPETIEQAEALQRRVEGLASWARDAKSPAATDIARTAEQVSAHIDDAAAQISPEAAANWKSVREEASDWRVLADKLHKVPMSDAEVGRVIGVAGLSAGLLTGSVMPTVGAALLAGNPAVRQFVRARGGAALGVLAQRAALFERGLKRASESLASSAPVAAAGEALSSGSVGKRARQIVSAVQTYPRSESRAETAKHYEQIAGFLAKVQQDPTHLQIETQRALEPFAGQQPEVAIAMAKRITEDHVWLAQQMPSGMGNKQSLTPLAEKHPVPPRDKQRIVSYARALANPASVMDSLAKGNIDWDGITALKARRPELYDSMRWSVALACAQSKKPLPYKRRIMLSVAFEFQGDPSLAAVNRIQASGTLPAAPDAQSAPTGGGTGRLNTSSLQGTGDAQQTPFQAATQGEAA
jgi:hypothetical protein